MRFPETIDLRIDPGHPLAMSDQNEATGKSAAHDRHHARKRRARRDSAAGERPRKRPDIARENKDRLLLYGLHTVAAALNNPDRQKGVLYASRNALGRLEIDSDRLSKVQLEERHPRDLDRMVGGDVVHQGVVLEVSPLPAKPLSALRDCTLVLVLDQVTDPHNVGAILRSSVAMDAGAVITTSRYSPVESGVLAKSASGALDVIDMIEVRNLAEALEELHGMGFATIGFDSEEATDFESLPRQGKIALVMGSEGKGLRQKTRQTCRHLAKLDMPGEIKSLNVSNAAVLALYLSRKLLET